MTTLTDAQWALVGRLEKMIKAKRRRNELRSAYMDGKHLLTKLPPSSPPYLNQLRTVLGWPAKAVEALARRIRLDGFDFPGDALGVDELLAANDYFAMSAQAQVSALVHSTVFVTVTAGGVGEPDAVVSHVTAMNGTGEWDTRRREFTSFLAVNRWPKAGATSGLRSNGEFTLFLNHEVVTVVDGKVVSRAVSPVRMPVTHMSYKPRLDRPFGSSRISRPVMSITDSAVRTIIRSEGTADFYGVPWFMIFGPDESSFSKDGWQMVMDRINAIPDNTDPGVQNPRADVKQFTQGSQQPHVDQLQVLAGLFAGETNIPVSSLGVGLSQANPTSAESYLASREDLIAEAEDAQANWTSPHVQVARWVFQIANGVGDVPPGLVSVRPVWHDTRYTSRAAAADANVKLVGAFPWMSNSDTLIGTLGFDAATTARLLEDKKRAVGVQVFAGLMGDADGRSSGAVCQTGS
ncbi:phage portal protein [Trueperella pyogenes]